MASPQTENGFVMIALDLFAAILTADLSNRDMIVLSEVLLQSYGPQKRRDVHLDPVTIEHYTGLHRNNGRAAIKSLVAAEILKQNEDGSHRFLKDYESWKPGGQPFTDRLVGGLIRFAKSALSRFGVPIKRSKKVAIQPDIASITTTIQSDWPYNCKANSTRLGPTTVGQSNEIDMELGDRHEKRDATPGSATPCVAPLACGGARASEELRVENRKNTHLAVCVDSRDTHTPDEQAPHLLPSEDQARIDEANRLADAWFPMRELGTAIARHSGHFNPKLEGSFPSAWLRPALEKLRERPEDQWRWNYLLGIVRGYATAGGPPAPSPSANGHAHTELPPSRAELRRKALSESARAWAAEMAAETKEGDA